jgi:hypothetical protein
MEMPESFGNYGVPTYYVNKTVTEPAGGGNVRVWCGVWRNGEFVPVCEIITPAADLLRNSIICREAAQNVFNEEQMMEGMAAH